MKLRNGRNLTPVQVFLLAQLAGFIMSFPVASGDLITGLGWIFSCETVCVIIFCLSTWSIRYKNSHAETFIDLFKDQHPYWATTLSVFTLILATSYITVCTFFIFPSIVRSYTNHFGKTTWATIEWYELATTNGRGGPQRVDSVAKANEMVLRLKYNNRYTTITWSDDNGVFNAVYAGIQKNEHTLLIKYISFAPGVVSLQTTFMPSSNESSLLAHSSQLQGCKAITPRISCSPKLLMP